MESTYEFDVSKESAPWINDYSLMANGKMTHEEHQILVARWNLHHQEQTSKKAYEWSRDIIMRNNR